VIYFANGRFIAGSDVFPTRFLPISLVTEGNYDLNEFTFLQYPNKTFPGGRYFEEPGKPYHQKLLSSSPTFIPTLIAPLYFIPFRIMEISPKHILVFYMDKAIASIFVVLSAVFLYRALRLVKTPMVWRLLIVGSYALATSSWSISAQSLWQHGPSQCFVAMAIWQWIRVSRFGKNSFWLGLAIGCAVGARLSNAPLAILFFVDLLIQKKFRSLLPYILGGLPVLLFLAAYNTIHYEKPWINGYNMLNIGFMFSPKYVPAGALGLLFSPSMGLLPNAPFYLLLVVSIAMGLFRRPLRGQRRMYFLLPSVYLILHLYTFGTFIHWWGGWSFCYRYMTDVLPFLSFMLYPLWRVRFLHGWTMRRFIWVLFFAGALFGGAVQAFGAHVWAGRWLAFWSDIASPLYLDLENHAENTIFDRKSVIWSLNPDHHLIGCERNYYKFRWKEPSTWTWEHVKQYCSSLKKIHHDFFVKKEINYGAVDASGQYNPYPPIILYMGTP